VGSIARSCVGVGELGIRISCHGARGGCFCYGLRAERGWYAVLWACFFLSLLCSVYLTGCRLALISTRRRLRVI